MSRTLPSYLRRRVGAEIALLLVAIVALMQLLELLDVTADILARGQGLGGLLHYAVLRTPSELVLALPLAVLLGSMKALSAMARVLEITAMRTVGYSLMRMLGHLLPMLVGIALLQFVLSEQLVPRAETALKAWWSATALPDTEQTRLWARTSSGPVSIEATSPDGHLLKSLRIYQRDASGQLTARLFAAEARWDGGVWRLNGVSDLQVGGGKVVREQLASRAWQSNLRPDDVLRLDQSRPHLSSIMLAEVIAGARAGSQPRSYYQTVLYRSFTAPLGVLVMLLLAMPTACTSTRGGSKGSEMLVALVLGLAFLLCDGILAALGTSGSLPPLAMAIGAPALFAAIGLLQLRFYERA